MHDYDRRARSRSRSPYRYERSHKHSHHRQRSRSHSLHKRHPEHSHSAPPAKTKPLPYGARELSRHDLTEYSALFALYLDIQKQIVFEELNEKEIKGRWKSFVGKWNRGELAEGWYDPKTLEKARNSGSETNNSSRVDTGRRPRENASRTQETAHENDDVNEDEDYGPALPTSLTTGPDHNELATSRHHGAFVPSLSDLRARDDQASEDAISAKQIYIDEIRRERKLDRTLQKERLDDILPRAGPGTKDRQLEKRAEVRESNRAFAASKDTSGDMEVRDSDIIGDEDSLAELKRMKKEQEKKKNERELRKDEILRARRAEREVRLAAVRDREEKTMSMFREIARQRFGGEGGDDGAESRDS